MKKITMIGMLVLFGIVLSSAYHENALAQNWFAAGNQPQDYEMGGIRR